MPFFRILGRLTFGAYLIHPSILRMSFGTVHDPIYSSDMLLVSTPPSHLLSVPNKKDSFSNFSIFQWNISLSTYITSYALSAIVCLAVEMPFSVLQKRLFQRESMATNKTIYDTREPETIKLSKTLRETDARINKSFG